MDLSLARSVSLATALLALASPDAAQTVRLNGPLTQPRVGRVRNFALSLEGTRVVYLADVQSSTQYELFSAPIDGSEPAVRLHARTTTVRRQVVEFAVGAGERAAFIGDLNGDGAFQLYSAPLTGTTTPLILSGGITTVRELAVTPDGTQVVFSDGQFLHSVPLDGSRAPLTLAPQPASGHDLFRLMPDSRRVLFTRKFGDTDYLGRVTLGDNQPPLPLADSGIPDLLFTYFAQFSVGADGVHGAYVPIDAFQDRGDVRIAGLYGFTTDRSHPPARLHLVERQNTLPPHAVAGDRVVYLEPDGTLHSIQTSGRGRVILGSEVSEFALSPDEKAVAFVRGAAPASELCLAPVDGTAPTLVLAGPGTITHPRPTAEGLVYFVAADPVNPFRGLYRVPYTGGVPLLLNGPAVGPTAAGPLGAVDFVVGPGGRVVYREDRVENQRYELWSVGPDLVPHRLNGPLASFRDVLFYALSRDGSQVAYLADETSDQTEEVFGVPSDGSAPAAKLNEPFPEGPILGDVESFQATHDGEFVVYTADQEVDGFRELYAASTTSVRPPVRLSAPFTDDADVHSDVTLLPRAGRVVAEYRTKDDSAVPFSSRLLGCPLVGNGPARLLDESPRIDRTSDIFHGLLAAPDESFVVYVKLTPEGSELRRVDVNGNQPPGTLLGLSILQFVTAAALTPDGRAVVVRANLEALDSFQLYRVELDLSAPPRRLHAPLTSGRDIDAFALSADGSRVVFSTRLERAWTDLYSVPVDGSTAPIRLNAPLSNGSSVGGFQVAPESTNLVYFAGGDVFYSVPSDGSAAARLLIDLPNGALMPDYQLSPDGELLVYRLEDAGLDLVELFAVRTAGGPAVKLNGPMVTGGEVTAFALSPDRRRIVYLADERENERFELFRATLASPGQPLWPAPPASGDVTSFQIDRESRFAVFRLHTGPPSTGLDALYRVPLDGSAQPELIHRPLHPSGDVQPDFLTLPGGRVVYRADAQNDAFELFLFQPRPVKRR